MMDAFNSFRKINKFSMMRSALAERIIKSLKTLRKPIKRNLSCTYFITVMLLASYLFVIWIMLYLRFSDWDSCLSLPLFLGFVQITIDSFSSKEAAFIKLKEEKKAPEKQFTIDLQAKNRIIRFVYPSVSNIEIIEEGKNGKGVAAYLRVSSRRQAKDGDSLEAQEAQAREIAKTLGTPRIFWIVDPGKSVKDFNSRKLNVILDLAANGKIDKLITRDIDRVGRKSLKLLGFLIQLRGNGVTIYTPSGELDLEKLSDFIIAAIKSFAAEEENRKRAAASMQSKIRAFQNRRWNLPIPIGYAKFDDWIKKIQEWTPILRDCYQLFVKLENVVSVTKNVNIKHRKLLERLYGKLLTRHQVGRILQNRVYIGKPTCSGKAIEKVFGQIVVEDPELKFVNEKEFEKARRIILYKREKCSRKRKDLNELVENCGLEILDFLPNVGVLCPACGEIMRNNGGSNYICMKCRKQMRTPNKDEIKKIRDWAFKRERGLRTILSIINKYDTENLSNLNLDIGELEKYL